MIPKQDRQGVRKASDIEQKYNLDQDYKEVMQIVSTASRTATNAQSVANNAATTAASAKSTAESAKTTAEKTADDFSKIATGLSIVDGLLCVTYSEDEVT